MATRSLTDEDIFTSPILGYEVPVTPKTINVYSAKTQSYTTREDFSRKQLLKAEKTFIQIKDILQNQYSGVFAIEQDKPLSRIAMMRAKAFTENDFGKNLRHTNLSLFTLSLQNGRIYNFPVAQIEKVFNIKIDPKSVILKKGGNDGCSAKDGLKILSKTYKELSKLFTSQGLTMSDNGFALMLSLVGLHKSGYIVLNVQGWVEYVAAGKSLDTILFGFDKKLFAGRSTYIPVDEVDEYKDLPREWLTTMFQALYNSSAL